MDKTKPRIAIFYDVLERTGYRDDGCPLFINWNLRKLLNGAKNTNELADTTKNVVHLSPCNPVDRFGNFDLNILVDYGEDALGIPLDWEIPHPNAYWVSDAHLGYEYRLQRAKQFDHVFVAQKWFIDKFSEGGISLDKLHYLPHAFEPDVYHPVSIIDKWDWTFIGFPNSEHRIDLLDRFIKEFPNFYMGWRIPGAMGYNELHDCNEKYNQSRIVINDNVVNDVNMRTFETMGSGGCLLTQDIPELIELFQDGNHLMTYRSIDEAISLAKDLLKDEKTRKHISEQGHKEVLEKHTYMHRTQEILKVCLDYTPALKEGLVTC